MESATFLAVLGTSGVLLLLASVASFCIVMRLSAAESVSSALGACSCFLIAKLALVDSCVERRKLLCDIVCVPGQLVWPRVCAGAAGSPPSQELKRGRGGQ